MGSLQALYVAAMRCAEGMGRFSPQDVSRLVDVCRQSIVYASLADLAAGLDAIARDPAVRVVRVKNRLSPTYSAAQSAGCHPRSESGDPSHL
jgi:hypothetical protein